MFSIAKTAIVKAGFELVQHPPYSPDLALSDNQMFAKQKEQC